MPQENSPQVEKIAFWILLGILLVVFFRLLAPFYSAILISLVLALTCAPIFRFFMKLFRQNRHLAAFVCLVVVFLFLAVPVGFVATLVTDQIFKLAQTFAEGQPTVLFQNLTAKGYFGRLLEQWQSVLGIDLDIHQWLKEIIQTLSQYLYQFSPKVIAKTANFFLASILTFVLTYFLLVDGPRLYHEMVHLSPLKDEYEKTLAEETRAMLRACVYGQILTALSQGFLAGIGFWIVGFPIALLLGLATFIMAFVPIVGTASVWVPILGYLLVTGAYGKAVFMALYGFFVISGIDNVLKPILIKGQTNIHPVILFLAIFGGLKLWGPIGLVAGPTVIAILLATLKIYRHDFR